MVPLSSAQRDALKVLVDLWVDRDVVLVGAMALGFHVAMDRGTEDLDLVVSLSIDDFPGGLAGLAGWRRHPKMEHRFFSPDGQQVDVLPAGPALLAQGYVDWEDARMSLVGIDLAFEHSVLRTIDSSLSVRVASAATVAIMKMRAWLDRPHERGKDLEDIVQLLRYYVTSDDDRRWADDVIALGLDYEEVSPCVVGREVGATIERRHLDHVREFVDTVGVAQFTAASTWHDTDPAERALAAFVRGVAVRWGNVDGWGRGGAAV